MQKQTPVELKLHEETLKYDRSQNSLINPGWLNLFEFPSSSIIKTECKMLKMWFTYNYHVAFLVESF